MNDTADAPAFTIALPESGWGDLDETAIANRDKIRNLFKEMAIGNQAALLDLLAPDVRFIQAPGLPYAIDVTGIEDVMAGLGQMFAAWRRLDTRVLDILASADRVIAFVDMHGVASKTGKDYHGLVAELFRFSEGKVVEWRPIYWDTHAVWEINRAD